MIEHVVRPQTIDEALKFKEQYGEKALFLAGGTHLNSRYCHSSATIAIIVEDLPLKEIHQTETTLTIGALTSLQKLAEPECPSSSLKEAAKLIYSRAIREQATVGGNIAAGREDSPLIPALLACNASLELSGNTSLPLADYLKRETKELILNITVSRSKELFFIKKYSRSAAGLPALTVAVAIGREGDSKGVWRIAVAGSGIQTGILGKLQKRLSQGEALSLKEIEAEASSEVDPKSDITGSKEYKKYLVGVTVSHIAAAAQKEGV